MNMMQDLDAAKVKKMDGKESSSGTSGKRSRT